MVSPAASHSSMVKPRPGINCHLLSTLAGGVKQCERCLLLQAASALTGGVRPWGGKATRDLPTPPPLSNPTLSNSGNRTDVEGLSRLLDGQGWSGGGHSGLMGCQPPGWAWGQLVSSRDLATEGYCALGPLTCQPPYHCVCPGPTPSDSFPPYLSQ